MVTMSAPDAVNSTTRQQVDYQSYNALDDPVITNKTGFVIIKKTKRPVIKRQPQQRHVVGIHHPMSKADRLPLGN